MGGSIVSWEEVEQRIEKARIHRWKKLNLSHQHLTHVSESIGNLSHLIELNLSQNQIVSLPSNIENLTKLIFFRFGGQSAYQLTTKHWQPLQSNDAESRIQFVK